MMTDQEREDYLTHLNRLTGKLATLLYVYHLGDDRPVIQRVFDEVRAIRERVCREAAPTPEPVYKRLQTLEHQAEARHYRMHLEDGLIDLLPFTLPPKPGDAASFRFNDAGIAAALDWLAQRTLPESEVQG